jgi:hypothetical protein
MQQQIPEGNLTSLANQLKILRDGKAKPSEKQEAKAFIERDLGLQESFEDVGGKLYKLKSVVTDLDWDNPILQQQLNTLQFFDLIVGHADRHAGNYIIDSNPKNHQKITGVKGIDNDDVFGREYTSAEFGNPRKTKTPTLPPVIDMTTATRILKTEWDVIGALLVKYGMTNDEIGATKDRFMTVQTHVFKLAVGGSLATLSGKADPEDLAKLMSVLRSRYDTHLDISKYNVAQWGPQTAQVLDSKNSYTGLQKELLKDAVDEGENLYKPEWK